MMIVKKIFTNKLFLEFLAVLFGVLLAFQLDSCKRQNDSDKNTFAKLSFMYFELEENVIKAYAMYKYYNDTTFGRVKVGHLDDFSVTDLLRDENLTNVISIETIYLIRGYYNNINVLNSFNALYTTYTLFNDLKYIEIMKNIKQNIKDNASGILAAHTIIIQEMNDLLKKIEIKNEYLKNVQQRINENKKKILEGKYKLN